MGVASALIRRFFVKFRVRPRSVLPGRQRWDIPVMRGRPDVAKLLEARLQGTFGITAARASPVTGRMLVHHAASLDSTELGEVVRRTVSTALHQARARAERYR